MQRSKPNMRGGVALSWAHYQRTQLPINLTDREAMLAADAFLGGARAMYGLLTMFLKLSASHAVQTHVMESLGLELGLDEPPQAHA